MLTEEKLVAMAMHAAHGANHVDDEDALYAHACDDDPYVHACDGVLHAHACDDAYVCVCDHVQVLGQE